MAGASPAVRVRSSSYGRIVVDGHGLTLHAFTRDGRGRSRCHGACVWGRSVRGTSATRPVLVP